MKKIPSYLADTLVATPDFAAGRAHMRTLGQEPANAAQRGIKTYDGYASQDKADATLMPEDGQ
jgi:hypothetical protein